MADARSLLRAERASRRITHPNASYSSAGALRCNVCNVPVKAGTEAAWKAHLHSTAHTARLSRQDEALATPREGGQARKKRKVNSDAETDSTVNPGTDERNAKHAKPTTPLPKDDVGPVAREHGDPEAESLGALAAMARGIDPIQPPPTEQSAPAPLPQSADDVDEAELLAFERDLAALEQTHKASQPPEYAGATISAAPMSAADIAAQAREEQSTQRARADARAEEEREEAEQALGEELEVMEGLGERVKRLRERRERLRSGKDAASGPLEGNGAGDGDDPGDEDGVEEAVADEDSEDEEDGWGFGGA